jgi:hypothetical protein
MAIDGQFGGRVTFQFAGQYIPPADGDIVLDVAKREVDAKSNQDESTAYMMKPKPVAAKIKLRHITGVDWDAIMLQIGNCTIVEENNGRTHLFTNTRLTGKPEVNVSTGEVDGLSVTGGVYTRLDQ